MQNWHLIVFFLLTANSLAICQTQNYRVFTENDGLPSSTIYSIKQDSKGYIWISTDQGVSRYDGYEFTNFGVADGLSDSEVFNTFEDSQGRIWFHTLNGKVSYYLNGKFYNSKNDSTLKPLDSESMITSVFEGLKHDLWFATFKDGIRKLDSNGRTRTYLRENDFRYLNSAFFCSGHEMILLTYKGIIKIAFKDDSIISIGKSVIPEDLVQLMHSKAQTIGEDRFLFTNLGKVYQTNFSFDTICLVIDETNSVENINNISIIDDESWFCTRSGMIKLHDLDSPRMLNNHSISSIIKDEQGNYWFGTLDSGLILQYSTRIDKCVFPTDQTMINSLALSPENKIWFIGDKQRIGELNNYQGTYYFLKRTAFSGGGNIKEIYFNKGDCWVATDESLILLNKNHQSIQLTSKDIVIDSKDTVWLATSIGLMKFHQEEFEQYDYEATVKRQNFSRFIEVNKRNHAVYLDYNQSVWLATYSGVYRKLDSDSKFERLSVLDGVRVNEFHSISQEHILLATEGSGLLGLDDNILVSVITENDSLSSNICSSICVENDSTIWVGTVNGLNRITNYPLNPKIDILNSTDGLSSDVINDLLIKNDTLWVATKNGLDFFDLNNFHINRQAPAMHIDGIKVNGESKSFEIANLSFPYDQNEITVQYVGISPKSGGDIQYRYKPSNESEWSFTRNRSVDFSSLAPGTYNFIVESKSKNSNWSEPASIQFQILKPYWKTTIFIICVSFIALIFAGFIVYLILRSKQRRLLQQKQLVSSELKSLKAQMNPHFLFNALNSIQGELLSNQPEIARNYLVKLSRLMRQVLEHSENVYVSIEEEIEIIKNYLEIEKYKTSNRFNYELSISSEIDQSYEQLPSMLVQPFLENSIWHGFVEKSQKYFLRILIKRAEVGGIEVTIIDNGIGRQRAASITHKTHKSKGMKLIQDRIEALNFGNEHKISLSVDDLDDNHGTVVQLLVPIQYTNEYYN